MMMIAIERDAGALSLICAYIQQHGKDGVVYGPRRFSLDAINLMGGYRRMSRMMLHNIYGIIFSLHHPDFNLYLHAVY